ncbi:MAG: sigma-70 family RNA polymerase sigma factor [Bacteroidales bacterium]|nr:sigma-70 family RNA polymerase sigma factor [Bacteroidales bacterium]
MTGPDFIEQYLPLKDALYRLAFCLLENGEDASDVVQELYVKLWDSRDTLDSVHNPKAYSITLMRNMCIDLIRKRKHMEKEALDEKSEPLGNPPDSVMEARENMAALSKAMAALSSTQREILQMRFFEDLSYDEISQRTGKNNLNIRVLISQARKKLERVYEKNRRY